MTVPSGRSNTRAEGAEDEGSEGKSCASGDQSTQSCGTTPKTGRVATADSAQSVQKSVTLEFLLKILNLK